MNELGLRAPKFLHPQHPNARVDARALMTRQNPWGHACLIASIHLFVGFHNILLFANQFQVSIICPLGFREWTALEPPRTCFFFKESDLFPEGSVNELGLSPPKFSHPQHPNARVDARALMAGQNPWATRAWSQRFIYLLAFISVHYSLIDLRIK